MAKNALVVERMQSDPTIRSEISAACTSCYVQFISCRDATCYQVFHACSGLPNPH